MCLGLVMKVEEVDGKIAKCDYFGNKRNIRVDVINKVEPGDYVLVHAGFALSKLEKSEGEERLKILSELEEKIREMEYGHKDD